MSTNEPLSHTPIPTAEELLKELLQTFFYVSPGYGGITWQFVEGITLATQLGPEYEAHYAQYLEQEEQEKYKLFSS